MISLRVCAEQLPPYAPADDWALEGNSMSRRATTRCHGRRLHVYTSISPSYCGTLFIFFNVCDNSKQWVSSHPEPDVETTCARVNDDQNPFMPGALRALMNSWITATYTRPRAANGRSHKLQHQCTTLANTLQPLMPNTTQPEHTE